LSSRAAVSILERDGVGTGGQITERSAVAKVSPVYRVSVGGSSTRARNSYTAGRRAEARDVGLRTDRGTKGCGRLSDRDRLSCGATIGILNRDGVGTCGQVAEGTAVSERNAINCVSVRTSSTRTGNRHTPCRIAKAGNISLRTDRRAKRCGGLGDCDRLSCGTTIVVLDCDCVGTGSQTTER